jgi:hypothetical protein
MPFKLQNTYLKKGFFSILKIFLNSGWLWLSAIFFDLNFKDPSILSS